MTGAVLGFGLLVGVAYDGVLVEHEAGGGNLVAVSTVHVVATLGNLALVYALVSVAGSALPAAAVFALVGLQATVAYNLLLPLEDRIARLLRTRVASGEGGEV